MTAEALMQAVPGLDPVSRPQRLAAGLVGSWRSPTVQLADLVGQRTFFFAGGQLQRVEFVADTRDRLDGGAADFERLLARARGVYGPETPAGDGGNRYASWSRDDADIYLQLATRPQPTIRLVHRARQRRDDRQL